VEAHAVGIGGRQALRQHGTPSTRGCQNVEFPWWLDLSVQMDGSPTIE